MNVRLRKTWRPLAGQAGARVRGRLGVQVLD
jgi:hypothetical protein